MYWRFGTEGNLQTRFKTGRNERYLRKLKEIKE
jgi:hypothetical protein